MEFRNFFTLVKKVIPFYFDLSYKFAINIFTAMEFVLKSILKLRTFWSFGLLLFFSLNTARLFAVQFTLAYYEKEAYYTNSKIRIKAILHNDSNEAFFFRAADNRVFNLNVDVRTLDNKALKESANRTMLQNSTKPYFYRDISLEPGEEYAFIFNLNEFVQIDSPGIFILAASYKTDLTSQNAVGSNKLYLNIRPRVAAKPEYSERIDSKTHELLSKQELNPDEVVANTLKSLVEESWSRYFLYLDLEYLIRQSSYYYRRFIASDEQGQRKLLGDFRQALTDGAIPEMTAMRDKPEKFEIIRTTYTQQEAEVIVSLTFERKGYTEMMRYTYYLHKKYNQNKEDNIWYIYRIATQLVRDDSDDS